MSNGLPNAKRIRIRSFYGFHPEEDGYVGWSKKTDRDAYLRKLNDGDLIMIYGASTSETKKAERSYVLGFLEIEARAIRDEDKASDFGMARKRERGWLGRWSHAIPVRRAWRAEEKMMIGQIAFKSYRPEAGQALAVHGADLDDDEIAQALKLKVREVSVYGEPPLTEPDAPVRPFADAFKPSRAFPGSKGERTATYEDGETFLYLAVFAGDGHALLGRNKAFGDKAIAMKVGVTNNPKRRCDELNAGIPPAAKGKWAMRLTSQPFPDMQRAEAVEALFKDRSCERLESLGGEFIWGRLEDAETLFWSLPGMARFSRNV
ncbi:T5orf172 domain-containing protein [Rhodobacter sp. JA431]|uniref:GIY-YIG nuclease family protein n=1 Tax=Rhodobacter sp. JA431 TaxID=570013 RepID=UPI000BC4F419|nr:GIY-YIG nuclease family protein [Rhodobacter sp. JA431]SOC04676.1 T5orf172 domain-containing protein [Rhodobacter sp. JA431]